MKRIDATYKYDTRTEMPTEFENFFMKLGRKPRETLLDYTTRFTVTHRKIKGHGVVLPDEVAGWMMMRKAGLSKSETTAILSQVGKDLMPETVEHALKLTLGLDNAPSSKADVRYVEEAYDPDETYYAEDYYEEYGDDIW